MLRRLLLGPDRGDFLRYAIERRRKGALDEVVIVVRRLEDALGAALRVVFSAREGGRELRRHEEQTLAGPPVLYAGIDAGAAAAARASGLGAARREIEGAVAELRACGVSVRLEAEDRPLPRPGPAPGGPARSASPPPSGSRAEPRRPQPSSGSPARPLSTPRTPR